MAKFLVTYHGGGAPNSDQIEAAQAAFGKWLSETGKSVSDPGTPLAMVAQVANGIPAAKSEIGGYSIIEAESVDAAVALLRKHPFVARGGTLQVNQQVSF
jgi:hypothetical protein